MYSKTSPPTPPRHVAGRLRECSSRSPRGSDVHRPVALDSVLMTAGAIRGSRPATSAETQPLIEIRPARLSRQMQMLSRRSARPDDSWLDFLARILVDASDARTPVVDRARLLAVFSVHLDDFFTSRIAAAFSVADGMQTPSSATLRHPGRLYELVRVLSAEHDRLLHDEVLPALTAGGVNFPAWDDLDGLEQQRLRVLFRDVIHPLVTPLVVDAAHPFPHISALSLNLGVLVRDKHDGVQRFACVQVPTRLPGFVRLDARRMVCIDALVSASLGELFRGMQILEQSIFRVTRSEKVEANGDDDPRYLLPGPITRRRAGWPVRLEVEDTTSSRMLEILVRKLQVAIDAVYRVRTPLGMAATLLEVTDDRSSDPACITLYG
jgi:polyphosphate kinase